MTHPPNIPALWPNVKFTAAGHQVAANLSYIPDLYFYSPPSVWSQPPLWGVYRAEMTDKVQVATHGISKADAPWGSVEGGKAAVYAYYPTSIAAIQVTNELLARGIALYRAPEAFVDRGRSLGPGAILLPGKPALANELASGYALDLLALDGLPPGAIALRQQRIAAAVDAGGLFLLKSYGFQYVVVGRNELNAGADLASYDLFINNTIYLSRLNAAGRASLQSFFDAGGDYLGLGDYGARLAQETGRLSFALQYPPGNSIVRVDYDPADSLVAGFGQEGYAFINLAAVFSSLGEGVVAAAHIDEGPDFLVSGFWPGWKESGAAGLPLIIHHAGGAQDVTLIGLDATFRAHPEDTFRLVANAIYAGLD